MAEEYPDDDDYQVNPKYEDILDSSKTRDFEKYVFLKIIIDCIGFCNKVLLSILVLMNNNVPFLFVYLP